MKRKEQYFEVSQSTSKDLPEDAWKVRPCEWYEEEYKDCKSMKARFHQYFIYGESVDCSQWNKDWKNCLQFRKNENLEMLEKVIESENKRLEDRADTVRKNDVWEYRSSPPENWNSTLPAWMEENKKDSVLLETQNKLNQGIEPTPMFTGFSCSIQ